MSFKGSRIYISLLFFFFSQYICAQQSPVLKGEFTQGSMILGKLAPGSELKLNNKKLTQSPNGQFVFGFGRDASLKQVLSWRLSDLEQWQSQNIVLTKREYKIDKIEGVASKYVSPATEVLKRIRDENAAIAKARKYSSSLKGFRQNFVRPAEGRISGVYGSQRVFNGVPKRPHFGLDIANKTGTPVYAPVSGIVRLSHPDMYYSGGTLIVDHGYGISSTFIHLSKLHVSEGDSVEQGDLIAEIGATGRVTGPHLDWRINWYSERLDPALVLNMSAKK